MILEEAIEYAERTYKENHSGWLYALKRGEDKYAERCKKSMDEFRQLAEWLHELAEKRKQPEIIYCGECKHYKPMSNHWGKCGVHSSPAEKYRTCQICDYCSWSERRTDG